MLRTIDLNIVSNENDLQPVIMDCIRNRSLILLKNYANMESVLALQTILSKEGIDTDQGFNGNYTGCELLSNGSSVEQYVGTPDGMDFQKTAMGQLASRLMRIATFFASACVSAVDASTSLSSMDGRNRFIKVTRYHKPISKSVLDLEFDYEDEYAIHQSPGIISVFPTAQGIKYRQGNRWETLEEPNCILIQTGDVLSRFSQGLHTADPIKFSTTNTTHLTIFPSLETEIASTMVSSLLLSNQLKEFPEIAQRLHPIQFAQEELKKRVDFCKNIFYVSESVLSLYSISNSLLTSAPELRTILPQISNMLKRKVSQEDFLRMMTLWKEAYVLELKNNLEITIRPPPGGLLNTLSNKSRKLEYTQKAEKWLLEISASSEVPQNVPMLAIKKRRGSDGSYEAQVSSTGEMQKLTRPMAQLKKKRSKGYIANTKDKFMFKEDKADSGNISLLERIRAKEHRAAALLSQRERQREQYFNVKTFQVFDILFSLPQDKPYTVTHLTSLIVDSLADSNNPIGENETSEVLMRLQLLLQDRINMIEADGSLRVFRWVGLDRSVLAERMSL
ncbi:LADA_0H04962g1_1 [Lachancea dasiensis]|uniref:LADA_0H04962g1_1 n=1 Tax=Lachancea dasiensis TaxID=1072105 RepID=A0A1G4K146_9SACH|nr:LADA_0H04962g1_1 [Lachancea dasiensis]